MFSVPPRVLNLSVTSSGGEMQEAALLIPRHQLDQNEYQHFPRGTNISETALNVRVYLKDKWANTIHVGLCIAFHMVFTKYGK